MLVERGTIMQRISWTGILAGLVVGVVTQLALTALGVALGAATIDTARGLAIGTIAWLAVSLAISAFLAGLTAARAAGYLTPAQGRFNGLITGMLLTLGLTLFSYNALLGGVRNMLGFAQTTGNAAVAAGSSANNAGLGGAFAQSGPGQQLIAGLTDEQELAQTIAENEPDLSQEQALAAARVTRSVVSNAVNSIDFSNLSNLNDVVPRRLDAVQEALSGPDFVARLQRQGLSQAEAQETARVISERAQTLRQQADQTLAATERIARRTASTAAWSWLLAAGLILLFTTLGGGRGHDVPQAGATVHPNREEGRGRA